MRIFNFLLFISIAFTAKAQIAKEDFARINRAYKEARTLSMNLQYAAFKDYTSTAALSVETGEVKRSGRHLYHKIGDIEIIRGEDFVCTVDHGDRNIAILDGKTSEDASFLNIDLDKILELSKDIKYYEAAKGKGGYSLVFPSSEYSRVKIEFNKKTFMIEKMILFYLHGEDLEGTISEEAGPKPRIEIVMSNIQMNAEITSSLFTYDKYLTRIDRNKYVLNGKYTSYSFINQKVSQQF